jgi:superfamily II DNA helicase RecQ
MKNTEKRYEVLRQWRNRLAKKKGLRPFRIFSNRSLMAIAESLPGSEVELREIPGVGPVTLKNYGRVTLRQVEKVR